MAELKTWAQLGNDLELYATTGLTPDEAEALLDPDIMGWNDIHWGACSNCRHHIPTGWNDACIGCSNQYADNWEPCE